MKIPSFDQYFPDEVMHQILSYAKVTSLLRCKSVCKSWRSIISKPKFIEAHHHNSLQFPSLLMITLKSYFVEDEPYDHLAATIVYSDCCGVSVTLPGFFDTKRFVGSCNGVVCVCDGSGDDVYLFNPLTSMYKKLPNVVAVGSGDNRYRQVGPIKVDVVFGFDCVEGDYKVLRIKYEIQGGNTSQLVRVSMVELYSSNADSWREIGVGCLLLRGFVLYPIVPVFISGPVLGGVLYLEGLNEIVTFDLRSQVFGLIEFPEEVIKGRKSNVLDVDGCIAVVVESAGDGLVDKEISLWIMDKVSDEVFWNKTFVFDSGFQVDWVFLYLGSKKYVVTTKLGEMLYDHSNKETKCIRLPSQSFLTRFLKHAESFVSIEGFKQVEENWM